MRNNSDGSLYCVGIGITLGAHITPVALHHIKTSDIVFVGASSGIVEAWVQELNDNVRSLQPFYEPGKSRKQTYKQMVNAMLEEVRKGVKVCGAFYGHPGVFALAPHQAIKKAKNEGYQALMEPGVSAEACLYADLGFDPGRTGCQQFETSQFMYYRRVVDTASLLILWQVGLAGDKNSDKFSTTRENINDLIALLAVYYPLNHKVIVYEAKLLAIDDIRADEVELSELSGLTLTMNSTLVVPPITRLIDIKGQDRFE